MRFVVCLLAAVAISSSWALPQYRAELVVAPATAEFYGMNSAGTIVGWMDTPTNNKGLIRRSNGDIVVVEPPPGFEGYDVDFTDINDSGQISGTLVHGFNGTGKGFVYTETGGFNIMDSPNSEAFGTSTMTNDGWVVFGSSSINGLWNPDTNEQIVLLRPGMQAASSRTRAVGSNWTWNSGNFTDLQGAGTKFAQAINSNGVSVGYKFDGTSFGSVIWDASGSESYTDFSSAYRSHFFDLNEAGLAVGYRWLSSTASYGTLYSHEFGTIDVNNVVSEQNFAGPIRGLLKVENNGLAMGRMAEGDIFRTVLLTPVPEPGTMLALGAGLAALLRRRRTT